jgi:hypothetical protein
MPRQHSAFLNNPFLSPSPIASSIQSVFKPSQLLVNVNVPFVGNPFLAPLLGGQTTTKKPMLVNPYPGNPFLQGTAQQPVTMVPITTTTSKQPLVTTSFPGNSMAPSTTTTKTVQTTSTKVPKPDLDNIFFFGDYSTPAPKKTGSSTTPIPQSEIESIFFFGDAPTTSTPTPTNDEATRIITGAFDFVKYVPAATTVKPSQVNLTDVNLNSFFDFDKELETTTFADENTTEALDDRISPTVIKSLVG